LSPIPQNLLWGEIENIALDNCELGMIGELFREARGQAAIQLDGDDMAGVVEQLPGQHAQPRPNFDHRGIGSQLGRANDRAKRVGVDQEILAHAACWP
jgi:hypothetical protein